MLSVSFLILICILILASIAYTYIEFKYFDNRSNKKYKIIADIIYLSIILYIIHLAVTYKG